MIDRWIYNAPDGVTHILDWPRSDLAAWSCSCGAVEGFRYCESVAAVLNSFDYTYAKFRGETYRINTAGDVFNKHGNKMVDLAHSNGHIFDTDGDS